MKERIEICGYAVIPLSAMPIKSIDGLVALGRAFKELPEGMAMFAPIPEGINWDTFQSSRRSTLSSQYRDRKIHGRRDWEAGGIWFWWEPREAKAVPS